MSILFHCAKGRQKGISLTPLVKQIVICLHTLEEVGTLHNMRRQIGSARAELKVYMCQMLFQAPMSRALDPVT